MNKWTRFLTHNLGLKLLSLCLAFGLWLMVINNENPVETRNFSMPVSYQNQDSLGNAGLVLRNWADLQSLRVVVKVRGPRMSLDRLSQAKEKIVVTANLSEALSAADYTEKVAVPVQVSLNMASSYSLEVDSKSPAYVYLELEYVKSAELPVKVDVSGTAADGYTLQTPTATPDTVTVTGGETEVSQVAFVTATVTVDQLKDNATQTASLVPCDAHGNVVSDVTISPSTVEVALSAHEVRTLTISANTTGVLPDDRVLSSVEVQPQTIQVTGDKDALSGLQSLSLPSLDLSGATEDVSRTFVLYSLLPEGVSLADGSPTTVTVTAKLTQVTTRILTLAPSRLSADLTLADGLSAGEAPRSITVTLKGEQSALDALDPDTMTGSFSLNVTDTGTYSAPVTLNLPEGVELVGTPTVEVVVTEESGESPQSP